MAAFYAVQSRQTGIPPVGKVLLYFSEKGRDEEGGLDIYVAGQQQTLDMAVC